MITATSLDVYNSVFNENRLSIRLTIYPPSYWEYPGKNKRLEDLVEQKS